jgi:hypothetical protein
VGRGETVVGGRFKKWEIKKMPKRIWRRNRELFVLNRVPTIHRLTCTTFLRNHWSRVSDCLVKPRSSRWSKSRWTHQHPQCFYPRFDDSYPLSSLSLDGVIASVENPFADRLATAVGDFKPSEFSAQFDVR